MSSTITQGTTVITPTLVLSYESTRASGTKVHELLSGGIAVSARPAGLRTGKLEMFFLTDADSANAEIVHKRAGVFAFATSGRPSLDMRYVVADGGNITRTLDDGTHIRWVLTIDYQEVN